LIGLLQHQRRYRCAGKGFRQGEGDFRLMLDDLYQEVILDHSKRPRNFHDMADATRRAEGYNPLCGDKLALFVKMDGDKVQDVSFIGAGCAISTASASLMTETVKGKSREEAMHLMERFHDLLT